jgi:replicative DNA helicase
MGNKTNAILQDSGIERAILASITSYGADCFFIVEDLITTTDFYWTYNQELFKILAHLVHKEDVKNFDIPSIQAAAKILGYDNYVCGGKYTEYLEAIVGEIGPTIENIKPLIACLYKLSLSRQGYLAAQKVQNSLKEVTGAEGVDEIIGKIEEPIFDFTSKLLSQDTGVVTLGNRFKPMMTKLSESPKDIIGLPTGFPAWDMAVGGGLRPATVNVIGARPKKGKSFFCINVARNVAENKIPVLYLDTELTNETQLHRLTSLVTGVSLNRIETGQFSNDKNESKAVWSCEEHISGLPIDHFSIAGLSPQSVISIARRWLSKRVGFMDSGVAKPCLIIYDYLKLMDESGLQKGLQEYQLLGFVVTALHNFATKYRLPVLATVQLNRDGIDKEGAEVISGSDRIVWLCSNFTILKSKTQTEFNDDPPSNGAKKLIVTDTRYGPGMESGEYINIIDKLEIAKLQEGKPFSAVLQATLGNVVE